MSLFDGVANEIIIRIMGLTSAGDIVSLASCCKHFSALAQDRLAFHRNERANAPDVVTGWQEEWTTDEHPSKHLQDILNNDDRRFYTKVMKIGLWDYGQASESEIKAYSTLVALVGTQYGHRLTALVANSYNALLPDVKNYGLEKWTKDIKEGKHEATVLLLFTLYPNLETLEIHDPNETWSRGAWGEFFYSLIQIAKHPVKNTLRVFSKVSKIVLRGISEAAAGMLYADLFMELPTVRKILGPLVDARGFQWTAGMGTSNTTHLAFRGDIDEASLSSLIRGCRALEYFSFQLNTDEPWSRGVDRENELNSLKFGPQAVNDIASIESKKAKSYGNVNRRDETNRPRWEPRVIVATLLQCASKSLVSLSLTALSLEAVVPLSNDEPFVDSLRSFRALKVLFLDTMMLFKKTGPSSSVSSSAEKPQQQTLWEDMKPHRLVDFLPVTIEDFRMTSGFVGQGLSREDVKEMFRGLPDGRNRLPNLKIIRVERKNLEQSDEEEEMEMEQSEEEEETEMGQSEEEEETEMGQSEEEEDGELELCERCHENDIQIYFIKPNPERLNFTV